MADLNRHCQFMRQSLQRHLPQPTTAAIAPVRADQPFLRRRIAGTRGLPAHVPPPTADGLDPLPSTVPEVADQFFLFRVHRNCWLRTLLKDQDGGVDIFKLSISIRMAIPLLPFAVALQAIPSGTQQAAYRAFTHRMPLRSQFSRLRYPTDASPTIVLRFDCRPLPPHPLIHQRQQRKILGPNLFDGVYVFHTRHSIQRQKSVNLF